jgi:hypothetical protein
MQGTVSRRGTAWRRLASWSRAHGALATCANAGRDQHVTQEGCLTGLRARFQGRRAATSAKVTAAPSLVTTRTQEVEAALPRAIRRTLAIRSAARLAGSITETAGSLGLASLAPGAGRRRTSDAGLPVPRALPMKLAFLGPHAVDLFRRGNWRGNGGRDRRGRGDALRDARGRRGLDGGGLRGSRRGAGDWRGHRRCTLRGTCARLPAAQPGRAHHGKPGRCKSSSGPHPTLDITSQLGPRHTRRAFVVPNQSEMRVS